MSILYTAVFEAVAVTAQQDLFEITTPSGFCAVIHQIIISQSTEVGDAQEEGLRLRVRKGATTTGTGGTTVTSNPLDRPASTAGSTVKANNTTKAINGTIITLHSEAWNVRNTFVLLPTPKMAILIAPSTRLTLELATTPADSITMDGVMYFEELG